MPIEHVSEAIKEWKARKPLYDAQRAYYNGQHELKFATQDFQQKHGALFEDLRENLCEAVVTAHTDSLSIETWGDQLDQDKADELGLSRLEGLVNREMVRCGDAYSVTWKGRGETPRPRYHRADQIVPFVDDLDPAVLDRAAKPWIAHGHGRVNIYYADRVERWVTRNQLPSAAEASYLDAPDDPDQWVPFAGDGEPDTIGHDFGAVPVCWWRRDADDTEGYGRSVLDNVIPLQDALNKGLADLLVLSETYARPFWYLLRYRPEQTNPLIAAQETLRAVSTASGRFDPNRQQIVTHDGEGPFGQLEPPDLMRLIEQQRELKNKIGSVSGVPTYYFTQTSGQVPSGESLRVLRSRLTAAVRNLARDSAPVWRGQASLLGLDGVTPVHADPMPLDETEKFDNALKLHSLGVALEDIVAYLRMPDPEGVVSRAAQARAQSAAAVGEAFRVGQIGY